MEKPTGYLVEGAAERAAQKELTGRVGTRLTRRSTVKRLKWSKFGLGAKDRSTT
jgi:hypothetical protein